jgi:hypothetical protein
MAMAFDNNDDGNSNNWPVNFKVSEIDSFLVQSSSLWNIPSIILFLEGSFGHYTISRYFPSSTFITLN